MKDGLYIVKWKGEYFYSKNSIITIAEYKSTEYKSGAWYYIGSEVPIEKPPFIIYARIDIEEKDDNMIGLPTIELISNIDMGPESPKTIYKRTK